MKTTLLSVLASGVCASVALAEPVSPTAGAQDATAEAHAAGPVALTEAEMDVVTAGGDPWGPRVPRGTVTHVVMEPIIVKSTCCKGGL